MSVIEQPKCYACGRFVKADEASQCIDEHGDYGKVHSVEYECVICRAEHPRRFRSELERLPGEFVS